MSGKFKQNALPTKRSCLVVLLNYKIKKQNQVLLNNKEPFVSTKNYNV